MDCATFNVNGLGECNKRREVLNWIADKKDDIILLQETHSTPDCEQNWKNIWSGRILFNHGTSNSLGTAFLVANRNIQVNLHKIIVPGRLAILEFAHEGLDYCIANIYASNQDETSCVEKILEEIYGRDKDDFILMAGDWNTVLDNIKDKLGGARAHANKKRQALINSAMEELGLHDPFRLVNPDSRTYSHVNKRCKTQSRLDFFLVDDNVINFPTCESTISHGFRSDHSYVQLKLRGNKINQGKGYWKMNNSLLNDTEYCEGVKNIIDDSASENFDSHGGLWDVIKMKIKDYTIRYSKTLAQNRRTEKADLQQLVQDIKTRITSENENNREEVVLDNLYLQLNEAEASLNEVISAEIQGLITRAKVKWAEEGERSTKYFLGLEKSAQKRRSITKLVTDSRDILTKQDEISKHVVSFYQNLFLSRRPVKRGIEDYLNSSELDTIDQDFAAELDTDISLEELSTVVESLKNNKSPGWDGLTNEFYKKFWDKIKNLLHSAIKESVTSRMLPPSLRIGVITLLPKPKTPSELNFIKNWRPITLLNTDYKIFTHVIKNRILKTVPFLISCTQSGFQAGRSTTDNLTLMYLVLENFNNNPQREGLLLQVDYEKAFDSVEHEFIFSTMKKMGFGEPLINLVKLAFSGCMSFANVNGHLSDTIFIGRGLHQGSPLSPILFLLVAQVFTTNMEKNPAVEGIIVDNVQLLQSLFADDTDIFLKADEVCVQAVFGELEIFGRHSGCRFNIDKTRCTPLGRSRSNTQLISSLRQSYGQGFVPDDGYFTALGITFNASNIAETPDLNYDRKITKVKELIKMWERRNMTIYGRLTLIKCFLLSQFVYLISPLPSPSKSLVKTINGMLYKFLWGGGREKLKRELLDIPKEKGGIGMINLENFVLSLKVRLISKILDINFHHSWKTILLNQLRFPEHPLISLEANAVKDNRNFCMDLVNCLNTWKEKVACIRGKTANFCIWGGGIPGNSSLLWNEALIRKNILYGSDLVSETGELMNYNEFRYKYNFRSSSFTKTDYAHVVIALRRFSSNDNQLKSISNMDSAISLMTLIAEDRTSITDPSSKTIRDIITVSPNFEILSTPQFKKWSNQIEGLCEQTWTVILEKLYKLTNHYKLIQHQYQIFTMIATSKYMRYKMKIDNSFTCSHCTAGKIEDLSHIYLECASTANFYILVEQFIKTKIDRHFVSTKLIQFTSYHRSKIISYIYLVANWYISRKRQYNKSLHLDEFCKHLKILQVGERAEIKTGLDTIIFT